MDWEGALLRQRKGATIAKAFVDLEGSTAPISHINENIQDAQQLLSKSNFHWGLPKRKMLNQTRDASRHALRARARRAWPNGA
jgi:hypothetical protein